MEQFGKNLRYYRKQRRLTQTELAGRAGVAPAYVSQIESSLRMPSLKVARRFADTLKIELPILLGTEEQAVAESDGLSDSEKLELLRRLVRSVEHDQEHRPNGGDPECYAGSQGFVLCRTASSTVRLYTYSENAACSAPATVHSHTGEEMIYCAAGRLRLVVDEREEVLRAGDSRTIDGSRPHTLHGDFGSVAVSTVTPPLTSGTHREWSANINGERHG